MNVNDMQRRFWYNRMMNVTQRGYNIRYAAGVAAAQPSHGEPGFIINGEKVDTLNQMIALLNASTSPTNTVTLRGDMVLDETETGTSLPTICKNLTLDLNGYTIVSNKVFNNVDEINALFRITNYGSGDDAVAPDVIIKNGNIKCTIPADGIKTRVIRNESSAGEMYLQNVNVYLDTTKLVNTDFNAVAINIWQDGTSSTVLNNVNCEVIGNNDKTCALEIQVCKDNEVTITNSNFKSTNINPAATYVGRGWRGATVGIADGSIVHMSNCTITGKNATATVNVWNSGASVDMTNCNVIADADAGVTPGPCIYTEYAATNAEMFPIVTMNDVNCTFPESTDSEMFAYQPNGATSGGMSKFLLNDGTYEKFIFTETTPTLQTIVSAGTFDRNIALNPAVTLAEGKTCTQDPTTGKWIVQ